MSADTGEREDTSGTLRKSCVSLTDEGIPMTEKKAPTIDLQPWHYQADT
jgi:hypothetical protein